jgi:hypothetical protein
MTDKKEVEKGIEAIESGKCYIYPEPVKILIEIGKLYLKGELVEPATREEIENIIDSQFALTLSFTEVAPQDYRQMRYMTAEMLINKVGKPNAK